ncbi:hypothetical protein BpHYR1_013268 [Brachionus plicatilis]|uniref:Uncharacterized protein n=1 Tax=Brachionus plicatilis TaxID=10195 RepID=A0A3M7SQE1_BRAPC|nr:hypothetical protein BpHYR1_013268 [Brachionus plicatilis]
MIHSNSFESLIGPKWLTIFTHFVFGVGHKSLLHSLGGLNGCRHKCCLSEAPCSKKRVLVARRNEVLWSLKKDTRLKTKINEGKIEQEKYDTAQNKINIYLKTIQMNGLTKQRHKAKQSTISNQQRSLSRGKLTITLVIMLTSAMCPMTCHVQWSVARFCLWINGSIHFDKNGGTIYFVLLGTQMQWSQAIFGRSTRFCLVIQEQTCHVQVSLLAS